MSKVTSQQKIKKIVMSALFCALAYVIMFVFRIRVGFLTFDAKDAVIALSGLLFGPASALSVSFTVALIEMVSVSTTGFWGFLMNFLSSATFSCTVAVIYKYRHDIKGAVIGLLSSVFTTTAVMLLLNLFITPIYTGSSMSAIVSLIPTLLFPFNLTKVILNASLVLILYKPISRVMKATKVSSVPVSDTVKNDEDKAKRRKLNITVTLMGILFAALSVVIFVLVLGGKINFFNK